MTEIKHSFLWTPRRSLWRWPLAAAALVAAVAHIPVIAPHLDEAPYMGEEFIVLTVACVLLAIAASACDSAAVYVLGAATGGLAVAGYIATRSVAFPQLGDDVGNWFETLGVVSVLAELAMVAAAVLGLQRARRQEPVDRRTHPTEIAVSSQAPWAGVPLQARSAGFPMQDRSDWHQPASELHNSPAQ